MVMQCYDRITYDMEISIEIPNEKKKDGDE